MYNIIITDVNRGVIAVFEVNPKLCWYNMLMSLVIKIDDDKQNKLPCLQKLDVLIDAESLELYPAQNIELPAEEKDISSELIESDEEPKEDEQPVVLSLPGDEFYEIQPGDTLSEISARFGVDMTQLCVWNNIVDPDLIFAGDRIRIK